MVPNVMLAAPGPPLVAPFSLLRRQWGLWRRRREKGATRGRPGAASITLGTVAGAPSPPGWSSRCGKLTKRRYKAYGADDNDKTKVYGAAGERVYSRRVEHAGKPPFPSPRPSKAAGGGDQARGERTGRIVPFCESPLPLPSPPLSPQEPRQAP